MIPVEKVIAEYLVKNQIGTKPSQDGTWPIYGGRLPDEVDECISVHWDSIPTEGRHHRTKKTVHHEGFQARIRSKEYDKARDKMGEIFDLLDNIVRQVIAVGTKQYRIQSVTQITTPAFIGPDSQNRLNFTLNCIASIQQL